MDVVIPLGGVQAHDHNELRYTLRSLQKHMRDLRNIYIIGELPIWAQNLFPVVEFDIIGNPRESVMKKIFKACEQIDISDEFILMADDIFINQDFTGEDLPFYATEKGKGSILHPINFAVHTPVRISKKLWHDLFSKITIDKYQSPRSFYCNFYNAPAEKYEETIPKTQDLPANIRTFVQRKKFFTINDRAMGHPQFVQFIRSHYPEVSRYEIDQQKNA